MLAITECQTAQQIASAVAKSSALVRAEQASHAASAAHGQAVAAVRAAIAGNGDRRRDAEVSRLAAAEHEAEKILRECRDAAIPLRLAHGEKIAAALTPMREAAAARVVDLLGELAPALRELRESAALIERTGKSCLHLPSLNLALIDQAARRIAGDAIEAPR